MFCVSLGTRKTDIPQLSVVALIVSVTSALDLKEEVQLDSDKEAQVSEPNQYTLYTLLKWKN